MAHQTFRPQVKAANEGGSILHSPAVQATLLGGGVGAGLGGLYGLTRKKGEREIPRRAARGALVGGAGGLGSVVGGTAGAVGGGLGGAALAAIASGLANKGQINPDAVAAGGLLGVGGGGIAGSLGGGLWAGKKVHKMTEPDGDEKKGADLDEFAKAVQQTSSSNLKADALADVKSLALASLGVGAAGRGAVGLYNMFRRSTKPKKKPAPVLAFPYPVAEKGAAEKRAFLGTAYSIGSNGYDLGRRAAGRPLSDRTQNAMLGVDAGVGAATGYYAGRRAYNQALKTGPAVTKAGAGTPVSQRPGLRGGLRGMAMGLGAGVLTNQLGNAAFGKQGADKAAGFLGGDNAVTKSGIPWYGPAMMGAGLGGLAVGWKGIDSVLNKRRQRERDKELESARQEFHDALMSQYDKPLTGAGPMKKAGDSPMEKVGADLDRLYDQFEKAAGTLSDHAGQLAGGYGMYAGLAGLMTGALVYDKAKKRQRRAILDKAMQRRERRKFNVSPPEITAVPEPFHPPKSPVGDPTQAIELNV